MTRQMGVEPELGSQWTLKHHSEAKKIWVKGETLGVMKNIAVACFALALVVPLGVLGVIDWSV